MHLFKQPSNELPTTPSSTKAMIAYQICSLSHSADLNTTANLQRDYASPQSKTLKKTRSIRQIVHQPHEHITNSISNNVRNREKVRKCIFNRWFKSIPTTSDQKKTPTPKREILKIHIRRSNKNNQYIETTKKMKRWLRSRLIWRKVLYSPPWEESLPSDMITLLLLAR